MRVVVLLGLGEANGPLYRDFGLESITFTRICRSCRLLDSWPRGITVPEFFDSSVAHAGMVRIVILFQQ